MSKRLSIESLLKKSFPGSTVDVLDPRGDDTAFHAVVVSPAFAGRALLDQHRMIYAALMPECEDVIEQVQITTKAA